MKPKGRAFIAGAYSADTPEAIALNVQRATEATREVFRVGWVPLCPNVYFGVFEGLQEYEFWLAASIMLLETCYVLVLVPGWETSSGVPREIARAKELGIPVMTLEEFLAKCALTSDGPLV